MGFPPKSRTAPASIVRSRATTQRKKEHRTGGVEVGSLMRNWVRAAVLSALGAAELLFSAVVHVGYAFYVFGTAVAADVAASLVNRVKAGPGAGGVGGVSAIDGEDDAAAVQDGSVPPIVLVHGIFGFGKGRLGGLSYFAGAEEKDARVLVPDLGALTSVHDRARELFYYLKGGRVDYGESHSAEHSHARFGRTYARGHYPCWSSAHPAHFVGHSAGAQVIRLLHQMLHDGAFQGHETATSERWVLSVTSLSGALNGSTRAYADGMQLENGGRTMRAAGLLQVCRVGSVLYHWLDIPWLNRYYDFGFGHFGMSRRVAGGVKALAGLLRGANGAWGPFATGDWILPDLTIHGAARTNGRLRTFPGTFYFSYATRCTTRTPGGGAAVPSGSMGIHPLLFLRAMQMSRWRYPAGAGTPPPYEGYRDEDWEENDGALNTFSMTHPRIPAEHPSVMEEEEDDDGGGGRPLRLGVWYYRIVEADHMAFIINRRRGGALFDKVYDSIFRNCRRVDSRSAPPPTVPNQAEQLTPGQDIVATN
ncbi:unnamed protein product [Urochloa decumbens]|uniref:Lipase-like C-terminal domain-containing protein n=1 Tax=Urochloa decumbens TaxID=240449 RepID=A0ABC9FHZ4_9POAL